MKKNNTTGEKKTPVSLFRRIFLLLATLAGISIIFIFLLTKQIICSIIFLLGTLIGALGFWLLIRVVDRFIKRGKGQVVFFLAGFAKLAVIGGGFFLASRISEAAVLSYIAGLLLIVAALLIDAVWQFIRSGKKNGT